MRSSFKLARWLHKKGLSRQKLRTSFLFKIGGERLFAKELWLPTKEGIARGFFLGILMASNPLMGTQMTVAIFPAIFIKANVPLTLALIWTTNFATLPFFIMVWYPLGCLLLLKPIGSINVFDIESWGAAFGTVMVGGIASGLMVGGTGYLLIKWFWPTPPNRPKVEKETNQVRDQQIP